MYIVYITYVVHCQMYNVHSNVYMVCLHSTCTLYNIQYKIIPAQVGGSTALKKVPRYVYILHGMCSDLD